MKSNGRQPDCLGSGMSVSHYIKNSINTIINSKLKLL